MDRPEQYALTTGDLVVLNRFATMARLVSGVGHDVNNALQVIGGSAELLADDPGLSPAAAARLTRIRAQQARAAALLNELMAIGRQSSSVRGHVNIRELVSTAVKLRTFTAQRSGISLRLTTPPEGRFMAEGHPLELQQAVLNLIVNAEQALAGAAGGEIVVDLAKEDGSILVSVTDNGPGVADEVRDRIFEPFFTTRARSESPGLGLPVAWDIAERSGGTLVLDASASGARFVLRLPEA